MEKQVSFLIILKEVFISLARWIQIHSAFVTTTATFFIAAFTWALVCANRKLWKVSQEQSKHMRQAMLDTQRAFIFLHSIPYQVFCPKKQRIPSAFGFKPQLLNSGKTPAMNAWGDVYYQNFDINTPDEEISAKITIPLKNKPKLFIGPSNPCYLKEFIINLQDAMDVFERKKRLFVWIVVEYNDMFNGTPLHHTNYCAEIILTSDPSQPVIDFNRPPNIFRYDTFLKYNSAD